jgi:hypothetical protein
MNGAYDLEGVIYHQHSNKLMKKILEIWPDNSVPVIDLGCGHNFYVSVLRYAGYDAVGVDMVDLGSNHFIESDITKSFRQVAGRNTDAQLIGIKKSNGVELFFPKKHNVISLEVGEHLPPDKSDAYLDNVTAFGGDILMSWAVLGQAGVGHINNHDNHWVIQKMKDRGYHMDFQMTHDLRQAVVGCHCTWFLNTLMYFRK